MTALKMKHRSIERGVFSVSFITDLRPVESLRFLQGGGTTLWHEKHLICTKISMHVCVYVCLHTPYQVCLHTFAHAQFKHTHSDMTCVCFTFSTLGCYCFVAVLGAAAQRVEAEEEEEGEVLDRHRCLLALAALRHAKWFQVGTHSLPVFLPDACCSLTIHPEVKQRRVANYQIGLL